MPGRPHLDLHCLAIAEIGAAGRAGLAGAAPDPLRAAVRIERAGAASRRRTSTAELEGREP
jgi:hypothetical protein